MSVRNPKITIVTCTYNSEKYLKKCLESIEGQTYKNIEHVFNDSFSKDKTLSIIDKYRKKNRGQYNVKFFQSPPKGVASALNEATKRASGDIIHYLHSDDYYLDNKSLERVVEYFRDNPDKVWITGNFLVEVRGQKIVIPQSYILKAAPKRALSVMNIIHHENTFMKTELVEKYGGFNEEKGLVVEYSLWLNLIEDHRPLVVNDQFTVFIIHKGSTSTGDIYKFSKAVLRAFKTQRKEKVIPLIGHYEDASLYKEFKKIVKSVRKLNKLVDLEKFLNGGNRD